jgi:hypothetical protein
MLPDEIAKARQGPVGHFGMILSLLSLPNETATHSRRKFLKRLPNGANLTGVAPREIRTRSEAPSFGSRPIVGARRISWGIWRVTYRIGRAPARKLSFQMRPQLMLRYDFPMPYRFRLRFHLPGDAYIDIAETLVQLDATLPMGGPYVFEIGRRQANSGVSRAHPQFPGLPD